MPLFDVTKIRSNMRAAVQRLEKGDSSPLVVYEPLLDLTLKEEECLKKIRKALEGTGAQLSELPLVKNRKLKVEHKITLLKNGISRCLLAFPLEILLWPYKGVYHVAYDGVCTEFIRKLSESLIEYAPGWNKKIYIVLPSGFDNLPEEDRHGHKTFVSLIKHVQRDVKEVEDMPELRPEYDFQDEDGIRVTLSIREKPEIHGRDKPIEKTRPSIWNQDLRKLRDLLCLLYTKTKDCERVVEDVKLNTTDIDFSGKVVNIWQDILKEAAKNKQVKAIIRYALKKYPNFERREELEELLKASTFS